MYKENLVLIGNGMAGMRTLEELLAVAPDSYNITVFGNEHYGNYNRILLSPVLAKEKTIDEIMINDDQWYLDREIVFHKGQEIVKIDRKNHKVISNNGIEMSYDRLILATGSNPFIIPVPGKDLPGVVAFRNIEDTNALLKLAEKYKKAIVIGGGLLGLEAASGLLKRGVDVTVVHLMDSLMERQLDNPSAKMLLKELLKRGIKFRIETATSEILGEDHVTGIRFKNGAEVEADFVVMTVGIIPNIALAKSCGIYCEKGIVVSDTMQTYDPKIYAVGECVQHRSKTYGLVAPLYEQAKVCANHLAYHGAFTYKGSDVYTKLKVSGIDLFSANNFTGDENTEEIVFKDETRGIYKKIVIENNKVVGSILYGDTADSAWYLKLIQDKTDINDIRDSIIFGKSTTASLNPIEQLACLPDDIEICGCNGVSKGTIIATICQKKLTTLDQVRAYTKASSSCGSCTEQVKGLILLTTGQAEQAVLKIKVCPCTDLSHEEVKDAIKSQQLKGIPAIIKALNWKSGDGCAKCRPALNYYLVCQWPGENVNDPQSHIINERAHANIQRDGTFSVVPRIFGGITNPEELHAIANAATKFNVPTVKITGGQRIDLLGISKENLPLIWKDLSEAGLVSGHAYGKAIRTVKTCVGKEWCRFGVQESTRLGILIEKMAWGAWTPHKVKMACSGCPRNCAEATIKDLGVVCVEAGYEIHVGGNGGIKVRVTDYLCTVKTEEEVLEWVAAYLQLYREEARYFERTSYWIERVGLEYVKEKLFNEPLRKELQGRFLESQKHSQTDPWTERARGVDAREFAPIKVLENVE